VQRRVQAEYQQVQPDKIQVPEYDFEGEVKKTIVPQPVGYSKTKWEFPEEEEKEGQDVPRVKAQEWVPEHEVEHPVLKTSYQPGRIGPNPDTGRLWPPPGYGEEEQLEMGQANKVKTLEDQGWIQNGTEAALEQNGEAEGVVGNAPWRA